MIEVITTILSSSAIGSVIGGAFGWLNRKEDRIERQSEREFKIRMMDYKERELDAQAFFESQKTKSSFGDALKSLVRPLITAAVMFQVYLIMINLETVTGGVAALPAELTLQLYRDIVLNVVSLGATIVSWWFASRGSYINKQ